MYDKLRQVIKTDSDSQQIFGEFLDEFNARQQWEKKREIRRSRLAALILAGASLISIFFVVFANIKANELEKEVIMLKNRIENCEKP